MTYQVFQRMRVFGVDGHGTLELVVLLVYGCVEPAVMEHTVGPVEGCLCPDEAEKEITKDGYGWR